MASPFSPTVQAMGVTLGVDMSSVGETEVILLQQLLVVEAAIAGGGGGGGGITALTGDVTASGSGSVAATVAKIQGVAISGAAAAGNVLTASGAAAASWQAPSGGGTPGLPVWTFAAADSSDPASGKFTTNAADIPSTSLIRLSVVPKNGVNGADAFEYIAANGMGAEVTLVDSTGAAYVFAVSLAAGTGPSIDLTLEGAPASGTWGGDYQGSSSSRVQDITMTSVLAQSSIAPCPDGTITPVTSITTVKGIITAIS